MQKNRFRILAVVWLALLVGTIFFLPYILFDLTKLIVGNTGGGAGGAVAAVLGMTLKPLVILTILLGLGWVAHKRLRGLKIGYGWSVTVLLWLMGSVGFLVGLGNFWGANFGMGLLHISFPVTLLFLFVFLTFLSFKNDGLPSKVDDRVKVAWMVAAVATAHALFLSSMEIMGGLGTIPFVGAAISPFTVSVFQLLAPAYPIASFGFTPAIVTYVDLAIFTMALAFILVCGGASPGELVTVDRRSQGRRAEDAAGFVADEFKVREHHPVSEPQFAPKPVNDMVFWPMVAVCVSLVSFVAIQFVAQDPSSARGPVVVYVDANGEPMSADQIKKIENAK